VDFFRYGALPVPLVTVEEAERLAASSFGLKVRARALGSQQDSNFLLVEAGGQVAGVLKIANPAFTMTEIQAQDAAADHVACAVGGLRAGPWCTGRPPWSPRACPPSPGCCAACPAAP
jgi:hypothetical protein